MCCKLLILQLTSFSFIVLIFPSMVCCHGFLPRLLPVVRFVGLEIKRKEKITIYVSLSLGIL
jgi:hypothetical protein